MPVCDELDIGDGSNLGEELEQVLLICTEVELVTEDRARGPLQFTQLPLFLIGEANLGRCPLPPVANMSGQQLGKLRAGCRELAFLAVIGSACAASPASGTWIDAAWTGSGCETDAYATLTLTCPVKNVPVPYPYPCLSAPCHGRGPLTSLYPCLYPYALLLNHEAFLLVSCLYQALWIPAAQGMRIRQSPLLTSCNLEQGADAMPQLTAQQDSNSVINAGSRFVVYISNPHR